MSTGSETPRAIELQLWMEERKLTYQTLADAAGVSRQFMAAMLARDTMPDKRHRQLLLYGVPADLLPQPFTGAFGRPRKRVPLHASPSPKSRESARESGCS